MSTASKVSNSQQISRIYDAKSPIRTEEINNLQKFTATDLKDKNAQTTSTRLLLFFLCPSFLPSLVLLGRRLGLWINDIPNGKKGCHHGGNHVARGCFSFFGMRNVGNTLDE
jgi:hypothetical protein